MLHAFNEYQASAFTRITGGIYGCHRQCQTKVHLMSEFIFQVNKTSCK